MKLILPVIAVPLLGLAPQQERAPDMDSTPPALAVEPADREQACFDTVQQVREESGQPPLFQRGTASPEEPLMYYAVDYDIDRCDVLLVSRNGDVRDVPREERDALLLRPLQ
ncbi:hypothetical protein OZN62_02050 [Aurantiacibacter sp. MUD11]|uniref:hypothetical protein n=1 Tax=Aurantiacibacter sp. MUD11 TaxID=3003265 RepID=UPI0022AAE878|nr:hypothetical protein [Aurantiacibacter sp. MUD11]WAT18385.1 hypothetical protein OZN62_02050 [Aurantiacibacter sp. MUD11]